ncbi:MAG: hypothetical protein PHW02_07035, partial [bacterium]|nr:hypothetical protein [bacterium]
MAQIAGILRKNKNQGEWGSCNLYNGWSSCFESSAIKLFLCDSIKLNYRARINSKEGKIILGNYIGDSDSPELYCPAAGHYLILNFSENTLFLRSDPMGMRPLYYCEDDKSFYFSSNIKILSDISGFNLPDFSTIASILVMRYSMNERTEIKGVKRLKINEII